MAPPFSSSLLAALRAGTHALHKRTEAAFVLNGPGVTRPAYAGLLARLLPFYAAAELALDAWEASLRAVGFDVTARRKTPLLRRDLTALGCGPDDVAGSGDAVVPTLVPSLAHALGLAYVLEGATLGGQVLRRRVAAALDLAPDAGLAFFSAYGRETGPMWRAFTEVLAGFDAAVPPLEWHAAHAAAVGAARAAFVAFEQTVVLPTAARAPTHTAA